MYLPGNIRYMRKFYNMSQEELAEKLGYKSYTTIQKWESGVSEPPLKKLKQLADIFKIDMDDLTYRKMMTEEEFWEPKVRSFAEQYPTKFITNPIGITEEEHAILSNYRMLNDIGKKKVSEYITDLVDSKKYDEEQ